MRGCLNGMRMRNLGMGEAARPSLKLRRVRYAQNLDRMNKIPEFQD